MDEPSSISLSAYCTLRPKTNEKPSKIANKTQFNSLKCRRSIIDDDSSTIPYVPLENSGQSDTKILSSELTITETVSDRSGTMTDEPIECDLIDLFDSSPAAKRGSCEPEAEAINVALLEKLQRKLASTSSIATGTSSMCNTLTKKPHKSESPEQRDLQRLEHYCTLRKLNPHKRKHILQNIGSLRRTNKLFSNHHAFCLLNELENNMPNVGSGNGSSTSSISSALSCCDPEKIEDCLMELDAYLEEIDRNCVCNDINCEVDDMFTSRNGDTIVNIEDESRENAEDAGGTLCDDVHSFNDQDDLLNVFENYQKNNGENSNNDASDLVNRRNSILMSTKKSNVGNGSSGESMSRGHLYRNTICVPRVIYQVQQQRLHSPTAFNGE